MRVEQYDRGTTQAKREEMRTNPPHILLTNYMMLEYLLVRPADREGIFANHRCRFLVLDEVHTYRGILGSNIALLVRRLKTHLARATQDWKADVSDEERPRRYPELVPVGTSATIKSAWEQDLPREQVLALRDAAVQEFFAALTGAEKSTIRVLGEELQDVTIPAEAGYPATAGRVDAKALDVADSAAVKTALCTLAAMPADTSSGRGWTTLPLALGLEPLADSSAHVDGSIDRPGPSGSPGAMPGSAQDDVEREVEAALVIGCGPARRQRRRLEAPGASVRSGRLEVSPLPESGMRKGLSAGRRAVLGVRPSDRSLVSLPELRRRLSAGRRRCRGGPAPAQCGRGRRAGVDDLPSGKVRLLVAPEDDDEPGGGTAPGAGPPRRSGPRPDSTTARFSKVRSIRPRSSSARTRRITPSA